MMEEATLVMRSECRMKVFRPKGRFRPVRWYDRLWKHRKAFIIGSIFYIDGFSVEDLGVVSRKTITDAGVAAIVDAFQNLFELENFNFHAFGTGTTAENAAHTALVTEVATRATGTQSEPANNQYRTVGTVSFGATFTIAEHGVFSASSAGTMLDRHLVSPTVGVNNGDSIQATYTLTINSGG